MLWAPFSPHLKHKPLALLYCFRDDCFSSLVLDRAGSVPFLSSVTLVGFVIDETEDLPASEEVFLEYDPSSILLVT